MDNQQPHSFPQAPFHHLLQQQHQRLQMLWNCQCHEIEHTTNFKNHELPLARIKKIMKADEDVRMISAEAPIVFAKACKLFILELTLRSWLLAEENKRQTLQKNDIAVVIRRTDIFDFLEDMVPSDEIKEEKLGLVAGDSGGAAPGVPCCYPPMGQAGSGVVMEQPAVAGIDPSTYMHGSAQTWQPVWQQGLAEDGSYGGGGQGLDGQAYTCCPSLAEKGTDMFPTISSAFH